MIPDASGLRAMVEGRAPWTGHDVLVVTAADPHTMSLHRERLGRLFARVPLRVIPVHDRRDGNLTGTVDAWRAVRSEVDLGDRVAIVHDAGQATRSGWVTRSTGGSRGALQLGATVAGQAVDLLGLVALTAAAFANSADGVDVFWGSQLTLPGRLGPVGGHLGKLGRVTDPAAVTSADLADLGWLGCGAGGVVVDFAARGRFSEVGPFVAWAGQQREVLADLGSSRWSRVLLDGLTELFAGRARRRDLDPDLTRPWVRLLHGGDPEGPSGEEVAELLRSDARFRDPGAVGVRRFEGEWLRFRRPEEFRSGLTEGLRAHRGLRQLWGIRHPVERSWLGSTWVEGPEITQDRMDAGLTVDGVRLERSVVRDSALEPGSAVVGSYLHASSGRIEATDAALLEVALSGACAEELRDRTEAEARWPSQALVRALEVTGPASEPHRWGELCRLGRLQWVRGGADGPPARLEAGRGCGQGRISVRTDQWPGLGRPSSERALFLRTLADQLADPAARGAPIPQLESAAEVPHTPAERAAAVDGWAIERDPLRLRLGALLRASAEDDGPIADLPGFRLAWRVLLEHHRLDLAAAWARLGPRLADAPVVDWVAAGRALRLPGGAVLPAFPLAAAPGDVVAWVAADPAFGPGGVIGLAGSAAAGKSTAIAGLAEVARSRGLQLVHISGDPLTYDGPALRYVQRPTDRHEIIEGAGIYDDRALLAAIEAAAAPDRVVLVDGVFLGLDPALRERLDRLVLLTAPAAVRYARKTVRDSQPDAPRTIEIPTDFARKLFREDRDCMERLRGLAHVVLGGEEAP